MTRGPKSLPWYAWQPAAVLAVAKLPPYERGLNDIAADTYWLSNGEDIDWSDGQALMDRLDLSEAPTPAQISKAQKAWRPMKEYLDARFEEAKSASDRNRENVQKRYTKPSTNPPALASFDAKEHEAKEIWPVWQLIRETYPGDRITDSDFTTFEEVINAGENAQLILTKVQEYVAGKAEGFAGYSFERFIKDGIYRGTFPKRKGALAVPERMKTANDIGAQEYLKKRGSQK